MSDVLITATGLATPSDIISNEELVNSFNAYVDAYNKVHADAIANGDVAALSHSSAEFIEKASGIKSRFVIDKKGILDINIMHPVLDSRPDDSLSIQADFALPAAKDALAQAGIEASQVDALICACSNYQRPYPSIAIELQQALGMSGFAYDMNVACSSATFAIVQAKALIDSGAAQTVLVVNPEICSAHLNFKDRDSHFIFGDAATAIVLQKQTAAKTLKGFRIVSTALKTQFSNNIRNNSGFLDRLYQDSLTQEERLFRQNGRKVFKEVSVEVTKLLHQQLEEEGLRASDFKCLWLHQANANMNRVIATKLLGYEPDAELAPLILKDFANTASAGSIIAFHQHHDALKQGDLGLLCSFGAGYSIGSIIVKQV